MVDVPSSAPLPAKILLHALKLPACTENGATTVRVVHLALRLVKECPQCVDSAIWFTSLMVKLALDNLLTALHATPNVAQLTAKLAAGVLTLSSSLHAAFKFALALALSKSIHLVVELSAHLSSAMTPKPLAVLSTVFLTIGALGLSAHHVFQKVSLPSNKQEVERFSFKLHAVVVTAMPSSPEVVLAHQLHVIETARSLTSAFGVLATLAVVMVSK